MLMSLSPHQFEQAIRLHQQGRSLEAEAAYRAILEHAPQHAGAWHLLGVALKQRGHLEEALRCIEQAIAITPEKPVYQNNLGAVLLDLVAAAMHRRRLRWPLRSIHNMRMHYRIWE